MSEPQHAPPVHSPRLAITALAALGVVFGDIGTSPLYAFRECFAGAHGSPLNAENLSGAASLIVWSLLLIVSIKYLFLVLRLDNRGEGGILALSALVRGALKEKGLPESRGVLLLGLAGAALIYADGMLTPAISVLSAVEGLSVSAPALAKWTVPSAVVILAALFSIQRHGTGRVGGLFGPVVLLWFITIGFLGLAGVMRQPDILLALTPSAGLSFLIRESGHALPLLAAVFLAVTGGEALYADLGHFGIRPIRVGWFTVVLPCLVLNYLGQASLLQSDPSALKAPFFLLAPASLRLPLTLLATAAAVIASQALITGAFSLTSQAIQLGCLPRFCVRYTSKHSMGQVYLPAVNWMLASACILLVVTFGTSGSLAGAYGIAIALTMTITSMLFYPAARHVLGWPKRTVIPITIAFLVVDAAFLAANSLKIAHRGWLPITIGALGMFLMMVWLWGRARLFERMLRGALPVRDLISELERGSIHRVRGLAVYMSGKSIRVPTALLHNLKHNHVLHERVLLLHVATLDQPHAPDGGTLEIAELGAGIYRATLNFGFADQPDVPAALQRLLPETVRFNPGKTTYFLGRESYRVGRDARTVDRLRLFVFAAMARNASPATAYFQLPAGRVVELGAQVTL